jgi:AraC-like DNA-binding protein
MMDTIKNANVSPMTIKLLIARLFGRITDYYTEAGLDHGELSQIAMDSAVELLDCGFFIDFTGILMNFCEKICKLHSGSRQSPDERFRRNVNDCIERHSSDCLFGLSAIASMSSYSPSYFSRLFTRIYGIPFSQYLASYRVDRAKRLLTQESMSLHEVARKVGFCSTSYFCSVFKKKTGKSPRQYSASAASAETDAAADSGADEGDAASKYLMDCFA